MATLKDVAKEAELTVTTVSRVLNNRGYISDDARKRVYDAMKKLNYHPNEVARSLHSKNSTIIGLIIPHISHPYFAEIIGYVEKYAAEKGYRILLCNTQGDNARIEEYIGVCSSNRVAGIIVCTGTVDAKMLQSLERPVVCLERAGDNCTASVACDNRQGGKLAAEKLIASGCKHMAYIGGVSTNKDMPADDRYEAFREICEQAGLNYKFIGTDDKCFKKMEYHQVIENEVNPGESEIDGIFASSDIIAAQVLQVCSKRGAKVPEDIKVIGFDDVNVAALTSPAITTIHQPIKEMAELAVNLLIDASNGKLVAKTSVLPVFMVERESA